MAYLFGTLRVIYDSSISYIALLFTIYILLYPLDITYWKSNCTLSPSIFRKIDIISLMYWLGPMLISFDFPGCQPHGPEKWLIGVKHTLLHGKSCGVALFCRKSDAAPFLFDCRKFHFTPLHPFSSSTLNWSLSWLSQTGLYRDKLMGCVTLTHHGTKFSTHQCHDRTIPIIWIFWYDNVASYERLCGHINKISIFN